ncbi:hypothetical protein [Streptomyces sp. NPDC052114]|uniref:hypothetical protein n=1 Tax=unclassified Streptomyces TaxID=2593676 RepID=UPI003426F1D6
MDHHERPTTVDVHQPVPITPTAPHTAPLVPVQPGHVPAVASVVLPNGQVATGYPLTPTPPTPPATAPAVSRTAVNIALGGIGFAGVCGGLALAAAFITALTALVTQLIVLAAIIFGGFIAAQVFRTGGRGGTTVNIRKAVIKRSRFYG